jgi:hypothetical protein
MKERGTTRRRPVTTPGQAWDAYLTAQHAAAEAVRECGWWGLLGGTPQGDRAVGLLDAAELAWSRFEATAMAEPEATGAAAPEPEAEP